MRTVNGPGRVSSTSASISPTSSGAERARRDRRLGRRELPEHHLVADALGHDRPARRCRRRVGDGRAQPAPPPTSAARSCQPSSVSCAERREHRHVGVVAGRSVLALSKRLVRAGQRMPHRVVEQRRVGLDHGHRTTRDALVRARRIPSPLGCGTWPKRRNRAMPLLRVGVPRDLRARSRSRRLARAASVADNPPEPSAPGLCPPGEEAGESASMVGRPGVGVPADPILTRPDVRSPRISKSVRRA